MYLIPKTSVKLKVLFNLLEEQNYCKIFIKKLQICVKLLNKIEIHCNTYLIIYYKLHFICINCFLLLGGLHPLYRLDSAIKYSSKFTYYN